MRLTLKNTPEQNQLIQAMGSKNMTVSREAQEAFGRLMGGVVQKLLLKAGTASTIYVDAPYNEDTDNPSYPLDLYYNEGANFVQVWSQSVAGGLPTSELTGMNELKIATYRLDSAVSLQKRYARKARLDIIAKAVERMAQEVLVKQERNAWAVILRALAEASTSTATNVPNSSANPNAKHVLPSVTADVFSPDDFNNLLTLIKRINASFDGGTPAAPFSRGVTHLYFSPEVMAQVRAMAFNPIYPQSGTSFSQLPESAREDIYRNAGMASLFGVNLVEMQEFGDGQKYNTLFNNFVTASQIVGPGSSSYWDSSTDQIIVGLDNSRGAFIRPVAKDGETDSTFTAEVDDQYNIKRVDKIGWFGSLQEGRVCLDGRVAVGVAI